jgi:hypothetical protein
MPADLDLDGGYILRVTALDPATGDTVSGVNVSNLEILAVDLSDTSGGASGAVPLPVLLAHEQTA